MARPSKLTPQVRDRMVELLRAGNFVESAAKAAGIAPSTHYEWMARGAAEGAEPPDPRTPKAELEALIAERGLQPPAHGSGRGGRVLRADLIELLATSPGPYREYHDAVEAAIDEVEAVHVTIVAAAARKDWRASAWWLERARPEHWRRRSVRATPRSPDAPEGPDAPSDDEDEPPPPPPPRSLMVGPDGEPL